MYIARVYVLSPRNDLRVNNSLRRTAREMTNALRPMVPSCLGSSRRYLATKNHRERYCVVA